MALSIVPNKYGACFMDKVNTQKKGEFTCRLAKGGALLADLRLLVSKCSEELTDANSPKIYCSFSSPFGNLCHDCVLSERSGSHWRRYDPAPRLEAFLSQGSKY